MSPTPDYKRYILIFAGWYIGGCIALAIVRNWISTGTSGISLILPMLIAMVVGESFVKKQQRMPTKTESARLANGSFLVLILAQIVFLAAAIASGVLNDLKDAGLSSNIYPILGLVLIIVLIFQYLLIRWGYGGLTRKRAKRLGYDEELADKFR